MALFWVVHMLLGSILMMIDLGQFDGHSGAITGDQIGDGRAVFLGFNIYGTDASGETINLLDNVLSYVTNTDEQDEQHEAHATVLDHLGNPMIVQQSTSSQQSGILSFL